MPKKPDMTIFVLVCLSVFVLCCPIPAFAHTHIPEPNDLFDLSIQDLMDIPLVVSASRTEQKINEISVPMTVITAEDIHSSGLTNNP